MGSGHPRTRVARSRPVLRCMWLPSSCRLTAIVGKLWQPPQHYNTHAITMTVRLQQVDNLMAFATEAHLDVSRRLKGEGQARRRWEKLKGVGQA